MNELFEPLSLNSFKIDWAIGLSVFIFSLILMSTIKNIVLKKGSVSSKDDTMRVKQISLQVFKRTKFFFIFIVSLYFGLVFIDLPSKYENIFQEILLFVVLLQLFFWGNLFIEIFLEKVILDKNEPKGLRSVPVLALVGKSFLFITVTLVFLSNLGINVTALVASLGVGGVAVALALQNILGDLFASLSILLDRPFKVGDFIIVDDFLGTVEKIGLKTTRVTSLNGEHIVFSNSDLLKSRLRNYEVMSERRAVFSFGVIYQTSYEKLRKIPGLVKDILKEVEDVRCDRVHFKSYGNSSLDFEVAYYINNPDYNTYMDKQQEINYQLFKCFETEQISFAYPTRTIFINKED